eukprot:TRINITY_DN5282_c0_g1_i1.p2 TRINITY_DN5282_c0_g1~~TRINITY_DN5282_c0_g1_i1.p2  ORF type:complete len:203 (+),score=32.31 TRINITY_DN5282_c0_g1_i1:64-672(+)
MGAMHCNDSGECKSRCHDSDSSDTESSASDLETRRKVTSTAMATPARATPARAREKRSVTVVPEPPPPGLRTASFVVSGKPPPGAAIAVPLRAGSFLVPATSVGRKSAPLPDKRQEQSARPTRRESMSVPRSASMVAGTPGIAQTGRSGSMLVEGRSSTTGGSKSGSVSVPPARPRVRSTESVLTSNQIRQQLEIIKKDNPE